MVGNQGIALEFAANSLGVLDHGGINLLNF